MDYELTESNGISVLKPGLRTVDQNNVPVLFEPLRPILEAGGRIVLDLSKVQFINSAGLGAIVGLIRDVEQKGGQIRVSSPLPTVKALFNMVHLSSIVAIDEDTAAALSALARNNG